MSNNIKQRGDENKKKYQLRDYLLIQYQILWANIIRIVWQTVRRITNEILGLKGITCNKWLFFSLPCRSVLWSGTWLLQKEVDNMTEILYYHKDYWFERYTFSHHALQPTDILLKWWSCFWLTWLDSPRCFVIWPKKKFKPTKSPPQWSLPRLVSRLVCVNNPVHYLKNFHQFYSFVLSLCQWLITFQVIYR